MPLEAKPFRLLSPLSPHAFDHIPAEVIMPGELFIDRRLSGLLMPPNSGTATPPTVSILGIRAARRIGSYKMLVAPPLWFSLVPDILFHLLPLFF